MKIIRHQGGLIRFRIPKGWIEEIEGDGSGLFCEDVPDAGVLRVNVINFETDAQVSPAAALAELASMKAVPGQSLQPLANGASLRCHVEAAEDRGRAVVLHHWELARAAPPHELRIAVFSFTVLSRQMARASTKRLIATLDREIRQAEFGSRPS